MCLILYFRWFSSLCLIWGYFYWTSFRFIDHFLGVSIHIPLTSWLRAFSFSDSVILVWRISLAFKDAASLSLMESSSYLLHILYISPWIPNVFVMVSLLSLLSNSNIWAIAKSAPLLLFGWCLMCVPFSVSCDSSLVLGIVCYIATQRSEGYLHPEEAFSSDRRLE